MQEIYQIYLNGVALATFFDYHAADVFANANNLPDSATIESFYLSKSCAFIN